MPDPSVDWILTQIKQRREHIARRTVEVREELGRYEVEIATYTAQIAELHKKLNEEDLERLVKKGLL